MPELTIDESTITPVTEPNKLTIDESTITPVSTKKEKGVIDKAKDMGLAVATAARDFPGVKQSSAALSALLTNPSDFSNQYSKFKDNQEKFLKGVDENAPITSKLSQVGVQIPLYLSGEAALAKAIPALKGAEGASLISKAMAGNLAKAAARGAIVNTGVQQALDPSAKRLPTDVGLGAAFGPLGELLNVGGAAVKSKAKDIGSRFYDSMFSRAPQTVAEEFAQKEGQTLGQEAYDRGLFGTMKGMLKQADEGLATKGAERQVLYDQAAKSGAELPYNEKYIQQLGQQFDKKVGIDSARKEAEQILSMIEQVKNNPESFTPDQLQSLKQRIGSRLSENSTANKFMKGELGAKETQDVAQYRAAKEALEAPFLGENGVNPVRDINKDLGYYERLNDAMKNVQAVNQGTTPGIGNAKTFLGLVKNFEQSPLVASGQAQVIKKLASPLEGLLKGGAVAAKNAPMALEALLKGSNQQNTNNTSSNMLPTIELGTEVNLPNVKTAKGIDLNSLTPEYLAKLQAMVDAAGVEPTITSARRSPEHNMEVGGVPNSRHIAGDASDININNLSPEQLQALIQAATTQGLHPLVHDAGSGRHLHTELRR